MLITKEHLLNGQHRISAVLRHFNKVVIDDFVWIDQSSWPESELIIAKVILLSCGTLIGVRQSFTSHP